MAKNSKLKKQKEESGTPAIFLPPKFVAQLAEEVAKGVLTHLPHPQLRRSRKNKNHRLENAVFLDTSAIIDGRIFDVINLGLLNVTFVVLESILLELKHIADSQDTVKRERGRKGLERLEKLKKSRFKVLILSESSEKSFGAGEIKEVDEKLIHISHKNNGRIITCDYNLEKKANISGVVAVNVNTLANVLKVIAVPGETLHIKIQHKGKDSTQGVGYLDDGTMIVVEHASLDLGHELDVLVSRVIQTTAGRILFAKKI